MRVNVDVTLDALLPHVGPRVATHPLPLTFGAFVFAEAPLLSLIRGQAFPFGPSLDERGHNCTTCINSMINKCSFDSESNITQDSADQISHFPKWNIPPFFSPNTASAVEEKQQYFCDLSKRSRDILLMIRCNLFVGHERGFSFPLAMDSLPPAVLPRDPKGGPGLRGPTGEASLLQEKYLWLSVILPHRSHYTNPGSQTSVERKYNPDELSTRIACQNYKAISAQSSGYDWLRWEAQFGSRTPNRSLHMLSGLCLVLREGGRGAQGPASTLFGHCGALWAGRVF